MTETLLPSATRSGTAAYTVTGSVGTIDGVLSDGSDLTYVERVTGTQPALFAVDLDTYSLTTTEKVQSVALEARLERPTESSKVFIRQGVLTDASSGVVRYAPADQFTGTASIDWFRGAGRIVAPDGREWSQTALNNLVVQVTDYATASVDTSTIYELRALVTLNEQPSASITAPSASVTTGSRPAITWAYTDTDGDPQSVYEVRVFTAAQYGATGFDPATSDAFWSTGLVESADTGVTPDVDLDNAATFRAYVRAGHAIGLTYYLSDWVYQQFTVGYDSPPLPDLVASYSERQNVVYVTGTGRTNYVSQDESTFDESVGSWDTVQNCAVTRTTDYSANGVASLKLDATSSGTMIAETEAYPVATDGQNVSATAEFRADAVGRACRVIIYWVDDTDTLVSQTASDPVNDVSTGWVTASVSAVTPANATQARVRVQVDDAVSGEDHYVDKVALHPGPVPTWGPGGLLPDQVIIGERSTDDGVTWEVFNSVIADGPNQVAQFEDYTAPRDRSVWYRAKALTYRGQTAIASPYSNIRAEYVTNDAKWWLKAIGSGLPGCPCPAYNVGGARVQGPLQTTQTITSGTFYPLGRSKGVVVFGDAYGQDGNIRVTVVGDTEWLSLEPILMEWNGDLLIQDPFTAQKIVRVTGRSLEYGGAGTKIRVVDLTYVEV